MLCSLGEHVMSMSGWSQIKLDRPQSSKTLGFVAFFRWLKRETHITHVKVKVAKHSRILTSQFQILCTAVAGSASGTKSTCSRLFGHSQCIWCGQSRRHLIIARQSINQVLTTFQPVSVSFCHEDQEAFLPDRFLLEGCVFW